MLKFNETVLKKRWSIWAVKSNLLVCEIEIETAISGSKCVSAIVFLQEITQVKGGGVALILILLKNPTKSLHNTRLYLLR